MSVSSNDFVEMNLTDQTTTNTRPAVCELVNGDCLEMLAHIPDGCVDLICADLPYGVTDLDWDGVIPMEPLWREMRRVLTDTGTIVATASGKFTVAMANAGLDIYKYSLVWHKSKASQPQHSRNRPMSNHEDILVFSKGAMQHAYRSKRRMTYNPINAVENGLKTVKRFGSDMLNKSKARSLGTVQQSMTGFDRTIQFHQNPHRPHHPTQKPESLLEWIIASYSNPGDLVLDPTMGAGPAGVAAVKLGRSFVGIERDGEFFCYAEDRINAELVRVGERDILPVETDVGI